MEPLEKTFNERLQEIEAYLDLLEALEQQARQGAPKIGEAPITAQHQKILYSSLYLQLYNLVEATATWCIEAVERATSENENWLPGDLSAELRREWIRATARTHAELSVKHRLATTMALGDRLIEAKPIAAWEVDKGGGGNWDDAALEAMAKRLGCRLDFDSEVKAAIKRKIRDDKSPLALVKHLRNKLAHGSMSFTECGDNVTVTDLRDLTERAARYLRAVVEHFQAYIDSHKFLAPARRPLSEGAP